ncbi:tRNA-uridine aminocarboxypropyltransferase [Alteromonas confluentis]|uniref:tRNA-uridine aminocarboxypropyltransferase n=1 Tax=Alteromonas confluentis TaxID=1656094 RepID=A0A1E7ZDC2_9ALTE|nr:tRNA-uridine aminocarboxypropyltransferase [Alteromonas confluentis]OFC71523.1 hypothetical protein BFC18_07245 [Alteromonas confluentis]
MRFYCSDCGYPSKTCVCQAVETLHSDVHFLIIQHKKEAIHAKNTARLVCLTLPETRIIVSGTERLNQQVTDYLQQYQSPAVIYPSEGSVAIESLEAKPVREHDLFILLDGSWKQAFGMWKTLQQLHTLPQYHFDSAPPSEYEIRHTKFDKSLSTLEAVAYTLTNTCESSAAPLHRLQQKFQSFWQSPQAHRRNSEVSTNKVLKVQ